jgi:Zn-dependent peptidase ImmA (M78 family)
MDWARDASGRFLRRPYYSTQEMETQCETLIVGHLATRHGSAQFPVSTDDLTVLVETLVDDLDLFADLSREGDDVEGVTDFFPDQRPRIRIERRLSTNPRMFNRLRTTLTHELGHVVFHKVMFDGPRSASLFELSPGPEVSNACKRDKILDAPRTDWMEWQAGFACGAFLMPQGPLSVAIRRIAEERGLPAGKFNATSEHGIALITDIAIRFGVSKDAARVRLEQRDVLVSAAQTGALFT